MLRDRHIRRAALIARAAGLALVTGLSLSASVPSASAQVQWKGAGAQRAPEKMSSKALQSAVTELAARPDRRRIVVSFAGPVSDAEREQARKAGLVLQAYLGGQSHAFFATLDPASANPRAIAGLPSIVNLEPLQTEWKMHVDLRQGLVHKWTIAEGQQEIDAAGIAADGYNREVFARQGIDPVVGVYVLFHEDAQIDDEAVQAVRRHQGRIQGVLRSINGMVIQLRYSQLAAFAAEDSVQWIEPPLPILTSNNNSNRSRVGADILRSAPYNLTGAGVRVLNYDAGRMSNHVDFAGRLTQGPRDTSGAIDHATHTGGTIGGSGAGNSSFRGMAPGVHLISYGLEQAGGLHQGFLYTDPCDIELDFAEAINLLNAHIDSSSIGTNTAPNGYPCEWEGDYGVTDVLLDKIVRGGNLVPNFPNPFRVIWANGNERQSGRCQGPGGFHTTAPPACAKGPITVGALNSNDDSVTTFTSWGPTDDGRLKPDISGPGCESGGDGGVTSSTGSNGYSSFCGTSMACPTVAGICALLLEDWRVQHPGEPDPTNAGLRTILSHSAVDVQNVGPDYKTGYGSVRGQAAIDLVRSGNFTQNSVSQGDLYSFVVIVQPGDPQLKVTVSWDDFPATANTSAALINDLDLVVTSPSGVRSFPWTLGGNANPSAAAVTTMENHLDVIEQVVVNNPEAGGWIVQVRGTNIPQGPQTFSVAATPLLVNCSDAGLVALDRSKYSCSSESTTLRVVDCGLNTNDDLVDTANVLLTSTSNPGGLVVTLTETASNAAAFLGSVPLTTTNAPGALQIAAGDVITLTYLDADNGSGGTNITIADTATVDCTAPLISNVLVSNITTRGATIAFTTDELAQGRVRYGTTCGGLASFVDSTAFRTAHSFTLTGLLPNTTYFAAVEAADDVANTGSNDNAGACYTFTTPAIPDFFAERFTGSHDIGGKQITFLPNRSSSDYYCATTTFASELPINPAGGTVVAQGDNLSAQVTLADGQTVKLYGVSHNNFFIGSNGYVTFGAGDSSFDESYAQHFALPRVSGWFDDLLPNSGQLTWIQLADRAAITWLNCPRVGIPSQVNTFQIELFYDGMIRITWLTMNSTSGLVGLSRGGGQDPDFVASDISAENACGPRAPTATSGNASVYTGNNVSITLLGNDDSPASGLTYSIMQLPTHGNLRDPAGGGYITSVPYVIADHGNTIIYRPTGIFVGPDSLSFRVSDGGAPPDGGESNIASVAIAVNPIVPTTVFQFLVDDTNPLWAAQGAWAFGHPTGGGSHNHDPSNGFTGANVLGFNLAGDYTNTISPPLYLTSTPMNLTGQTRTSLQFRRWLGIDAAIFDHANIQVSNNGFQWHTVWNHTGPAISESEWSLQSVDISAIADNQSSVRVRFGMGTTSPDTTYPGWNLDDIRIMEFRFVPSCTCDWNGSGSIDSQDLFDYLSAFFANNADYNADSFTNSQDFFDFLSRFFAGCP
ncbi:MAG: S8 family serine peptidase [Pyrinomonadaceae bacterium]|nr:S8 family serine peptidase [Phycisphaerales bacterium]